MGGPSSGHYGIGVHFDLPLTGILSGYRMDSDLLLNPRRESISFSNQVDSLGFCPGCTCTLLSPDTTGFKGLDRIMMLGRQAQ